MRRALLVVLAAAALLAGGSPACRAAAAPRVEHHRTVDVWFGTLTVRDAAGGGVATTPFLRLDKQISGLVGGAIYADTNVDPRVRSLALEPFVGSAADIDWVLDTTAGTDAHQALVSAISAAALPLGTGTLVVDAPASRGSATYHLVNWTTTDGSGFVDHFSFADVAYHEMNASWSPSEFPYVEHHRAVDVWFGSLTARAADGSVVSTQDFLRLDRQITGTLAGQMFSDPTVDSRAKSALLAGFIDGSATDIDWALDPATGTDAGQELSVDVAAFSVGVGSGTVVFSAPVSRGPGRNIVADWYSGVVPQINHKGIADVAYHERNATLYLDRTFPPDTAIAFFLPKAVKLALNAKTPAKSTLIASGFFDTGPFPEDLSGAATLLVGGLSFAVPALDPQKNGSFRYRGQGVDFTVTPQKSGSSRAKFKLKVTGDFAGKLEKDGPLALRFLRGTVDGAASVGLQEGRYALGKVRGSLTSPRLFFYALKGTVAGGGKDAVRLKAGLGSLGATPAAPTDVRVAVGATFVASLTASDLTQKGDAFVLKAPTGGVTAFVLDYARETLSLTAKSIDLGALPDGAQPLLVSVTVGPETHAAFVRAVRTGRALRY